MRRTVVHDLSSRDAGSCDTFADRIAQAIAELMVNNLSDPAPLERRPRTLEQVIAAAIHKELPR
jgi:hypothetical protein